MVSDADEPSRLFDTAQLEQRAGSGVAAAEEAGGAEARPAARADGEGLRSFGCLRAAHHENNANNKVASMATCDSAARVPPLSTGAAAASRLRLVCCVLGYGKDSCASKVLFSQCVVERPRPQAALVLACSDS